jgi:hypothetical protein
LVIIGIALVLIIPLVILYSNYSSESSYSITASKIDSITNQIVTAANQVNVYGKDTQVTLKVDFPKDITEILFYNKEIIFKIRSKANEDTEIVKISDVPISNAFPIPITPGKKNVVIKSLGNSVLIDIICNDEQLICAPSDFPSCGTNGCVIECKNGAWLLKENCAAGKTCLNGVCITGGT